MCYWRGLTNFFVKMLSILVESDDGTIHYIESDPHYYIPNLDVTGWCCERVSKHVCCDISNEESCPICLDPIVHNSKVLKILCGHTMHLECADKWFSTCIMSAKAAKCPLCNLVVLCPIFQSVSEHVFPARNVVRINCFSRFMNYIRRMIPGV